MSARQEATQQPAIQEVQEGHDKRGRGSMVLLPTNKRHNNQIERWRSSRGYHCHDNDCGDDDNDDHEHVAGVRGVGLVIDAAWRGGGGGGEEEDCKDVSRSRKWWMRGGRRNIMGAP